MQNLDRVPTDARAVGPSPREREEHPSEA